MAGRPANKCFAELGFNLCKLNTKYIALCNVCNKTLKNTASTRLQQHRNVCKMENVSQMNTINKSELDDLIIEEIIIEDDDAHGGNDLSIMDISVASDMSQPSQKATGAQKSMFENFAIPQFSGASSISSSSSSSLLSDSDKKKKNNVKKTASITNFMDKITPSDEKELNTLLAKFVFGCNLPLRVLESNHFKNFVQKLRPAYVNKLPSRKQLSTALLDATYEKCIAKTNIEANSIILIDGWKNTASNSKLVVCLLHVCKGDQAFLNAWDLSGDSETGERLAEIITEAFDMAKNKYNTNVYAVVSDNASPMIKMGKLVNHFLWHSTCNSHTGNLLAKDVINDDLNEKVKTVLKEFKNADFEKFIQDDGGKRIKLPCETRWCSQRDAYKCFLHNLNCMKRIAADPTKKNLKSNVTKLIFDDQFIDEVKEHIAVLDPICELINTCQSADSSVADAVHKWLNLDLPRKYKKKLEERRIMALNVYALVAYYLHPKYDNEALNQIHLDKINNFLFKNLDNSGIEDWYAFKNKTGFFRNLYEKQIEKEDVFWGMAEMKHPTLAKLALKVLKIPASSAQIERLFSSWGHVHSSLRNRLTFERSKKLTHIYYSLRLEDNQEDCDSE